jgi:sulfoquinovosidase
MAFLWTSYGLPSYGLPTAFNDFDAMFTEYSIKKILLYPVLVATTTLLTANCSNDAKKPPSEPQAISCGIGCATTGEFTLRWDATDAVGTIKVYHQADPERALWETHASAPIATAGQGQETVEYGRGSFLFEDDITEQCTQSSLQVPVLEGEDVVFPGNFEDCDLTLALRFTPYSQTHLSFTLSLIEPGNYNRLTMNYGTNAQEGFYGFGTQYNYLNLKGRKLPIWCQEQGHGRGLEPLTGVLNLTQGNSAGDWSTTYTCVPFYLTNERRSLFLENREYLAFDFTEDDQIEISIYASEIRGRILYGDTLLDIVETYTEYSGRMDPLPQWTQTGSIVRLYGGSDAVQAAVDELKEADSPLAAVWIEDWCGLRTTPFGKRIWWNWVGDETLYPNWADLVGSLRDNDVRVLTYFNPFLTDVAEKENATRNLYTEAADEGYLVEDIEGDPIQIENGGFFASMIDLTNDDTRTWIKSIMRKQIDLGVSGWMADFGEALPYDVKLHSGVDSRVYHNDYPYEWAKLNREAIREAGVEEDFLFFSRSGNARSPGETRLFWIGDQLCSWDEFDGFQTVIPALLSSGMSGYALQHTDTGGWLSINVGNLIYNRDKELFQRWVELSAFTVLLRLHTTNDAENNHQYNSDAETLAHFARFSKIFAALAPYRKLLMEKAQSTGYPLIRHLMLHYPNDPTAYSIQQQFLLGEEILVAPVVTQGEVFREVYFPTGKWIHVWTGTEYGDESQGTLQEIDAPIGRPPVFYQKGSEVGAAFVTVLDEQGLR